MKSANALMRAEIQENNVIALNDDSAKAIAQTWQAITSAENTLADMGYGRAGAWQVCPPAQNAFASIVSDIMPVKANIICVNFQSYSWMMASGQTLDTIMRTYLGKTVISNPVSCDAAKASEIISQSKAPTIVALHAENAGDWQSVRNIAASATQAEKSVLMLVSAQIDAPKGAAVDSYNAWEEAAPAIRAAVSELTDQGTSHVIAMNDIDAATLEQAMMNASNINAGTWQDMMQNAKDASERFANDAYRAPVDGV